MSFNIDSQEGRARKPAISVICCRSMSPGSLSRTESAMLSSSLAIYGVGVGVSQSLMSLGGTLLTGWLLYFLFKNFSRLSELSRIEKLSLASVFAYVVWTLGVWVFGVGRERGDVMALNNLPLVAIPFVAYLVPRQFSWRVLCFAIGALVMSSSFAIYQGFVEARMAIAWMKNPIYLAYTLLPAVVALAWIAVSAEALGISRKKLRVVVLPTLLLAYGALIATNSRMALAVATLMIAVVLVPWAWRRFSKVAILGVLLVGFGLMSSEYIRKPYVRQRVASALDPQDLSWRGRFFAWEQNIAIIREHPVTGVGPRQNAILMRDHPEWQPLWGADVAIFAHSLYLQTLAESGLVGFLLLVAAYVGLAVARPQARLALISLALGGLTENVFTNSKPLHAHLFWILMMALLPMTLREKARSPDRQSL
jgi:O-antigen ligase